MTTSKEIKLLNGEDLHVFQIPSLNLVLKENETKTDMYMTPFRAYRMQISNAEGLCIGDSDHEDMEYLLKSIHEALYNSGNRSVEREFVRSMEKLVVNALTNWNNNNYGRDYLIDVNTNGNRNNIKLFAERTYHWVVKRINNEIQWS